MPCFLTYKFKIIYISPFSKSSAVTPKTSHNVRKLEMLGSVLPCSQFA